MGNVESFDVEERDPKKLQQSSIVKTSGNFSLYASKGPKSTWYEATLHNVAISPKHFGLFRLQDESTAKHKFDALSTRLAPFCVDEPRTYTKKTLKRLVACVQENETWSLAHVAVHANLASCLAHDDVRKEIDSARGSGDETPLCLACRIGNVECVRALLRLGADSGKKGGETGNSAIHVAAACSPVCLEEILNSGKATTVGDVNHRGETALHLACRENKIESVRVLLRAGADPEIVSQDGLFPIHLAVLSSATDVIVTLIRESARQAGLKDVKCGNTPLHYATRSESVRALVQFETVKKEARNAEGLAPLHVYINESRLGCVVALLCEGIDPRLQTADGEAPLQLAIKSGSLALVQSLVIFGADVDDADVQLALDLEVEIEIVKALKVAPCKAKRAPLPTPSPPPPARDHGEAVLCLDGGGIRGLVLIQLLFAIEKACRRSVGELFDWIGGTSTGGILAAALVHGGLDLRRCQSIYFKFKDRVFCGSRPYRSEPFEDFLRSTFGEGTTMADVQRPKVILTTTLSDVRPAKMHLFRNYGDQQENGEPPPSGQLVWKAARATGAAPSYFQTTGRFVDGGLVANNPTLAVLTEMQTWHSRHSPGSMMPRPRVVVSLGTSVAPDEHVSSVNVFKPTSISEAANVVMGGASLGALLLDRATQAAGIPVNQSEAWCAAMGVPFFRLNPPASEFVDLAETRDEILVRMLWETEVYLCKEKDKINQLARLLLRGANDDD